jgi:hypothetical protein
MHRVVGVPGCLVVLAEMDLSFAALESRGPALGQVPVAWK